MRFLCASIALIAFGAVVVLGHKVNHGHEHGQHQGHEATSYVVVTKHEDQGGHYEDGHQGGHQENIHHLGHHLKHHDYNGHDEHQSHHEGHDDGGNAKYEFIYGVKDSKTGDIKDHWESRDGHSVKGKYSLKEADGTTRIVEYTSDKKKGFEATVHKIGSAHHDQGHSGNHHGHH